MADDRVDDMWARNAMMSGGSGRPNEVGDQLDTDLDADIAASRRARTVAEPTTEAVRHHDGTPLAGTRRIVTDYRGDPISDSDLTDEPEVSKSRPTDLTRDELTHLYGVWKRTGDLQNRDAALWDEVNWIIASRVNDAVAAARADDKYELGFDRGGRYERERITAAVEADLCARHQPQSPTRQPCAACSQDAQALTGWDPWMPEADRG